MRGYNFIEHTADIAVDVWGESYEELFTASAEAYLECTANPLTTSKPTIHSLSINSATTEELLVEFLNELNYLVDVKKLIFFETEQIDISKKNNVFELSVTVKLNKLGPEKDLRNEIKAITYHQMKIEYKENKYSTRIVFDI